MLTSIASHPCRRLCRFPLFATECQNMGHPPWRRSGPLRSPSVSSCATYRKCSRSFCVRQAAIVQGAALRGLEGTAPRKKRVRRHYGFRLAMGFREGIDPEHMAVVNRVDGIKRCHNRVNWVITKVCYFGALRMYTDDDHRERLSKAQRLASRHCKLTRRRVSS